MDNCFEIIVLTDTFNIYSLKNIKSKQEETASENEKEIFKIFFLFKITINYFLLVTKMYC
jgi:hypothetical protein